MGQPDTYDTLTMDEFIRSVQVNITSPHSFFLGAGTSITSGMPSATMCIWDWKRRIFLTSNMELRDQVSDLSMPSVQQRIQKWLDLQESTPDNYSAQEYGYYIEKCFPIPNDRRAYFQGLTKNAQPHVGYKLICLLAQAGIVDSVWTTNFDSLTIKASGQFKITPIEIGLDSAHRANRGQTAHELKHVCLHGDYRYDNLKNTDAELQSQDEKLRKSLIEKAKDTHLIVSGYSGRDESIMNAFTEAYTQTGSGRLYWCGYDEHPSDPVIKLLAHAKKSGRSAYYIPTNGFDTTLAGR